MGNNMDAWIRQAKELLAKGHTAHDVIPFAPSILDALYGPKSTQLEAFNNRMAEISRLKGGQSFARQQLASTTIRNVVGEAENGLIVNVRAQVAGEVLSELINLGKEMRMSEF